MDISSLAISLTNVLVPLLHYFVQSGDKSAEGTGKAVADQGLEWEKSLWSRLRPRVEAKPAALEAANDAAQAPEDEDAQAALRLQLKKLLAEDQSLAEDVSRWLEHRKATGINVSASGERNVVIGGNVAGNTIITGDRNKVKI